MPHPNDLSPEDRAIAVAKFGAFVACLRVILRTMDSDDGHPGARAWFDECEGALMQAAGGDEETAFHLAGVKLEELAPEIGQLLTGGRIH